ncbi:hypothetical protein EUX98_g5225 [Antrodiella citrinella]|uniref:Nuclear pore complex protein NUP96 C-terminal domain-containing protein n=1 Tax=Antrodiella citrinella TaxID=2447956 RepID=A0A4V3XIE5_9APHY|nr:hypothetical protein EUX98_g5225 [Antrodiella citrinella]
MARFRAYASESEDEHGSASESAEVEVQEQKSNGVYGAVESEDSGMGTEEEYHPSDGMDEDEDAEREDEEDFQDSSPQPEPRATIGDPTIIPWARGAGVDPHRIHVMQSAFFRVPEEARAMREVEEHVKARSVKKLALSNTLNRKHSRDSDGDGLRADSVQRRSFAHDMEPLPYRPSRKYARVGNAASAVSGNENALIDAGLTMGRSFRVGWGPGGTLAHLGHLCGPADSSSETANSSIVNITSIPIFTSSQEESVKRATRLLSHHLGHKNKDPAIVMDADGIPCANPSPDLTFTSFASLFSATDTSFEANLFRLGRALFDPLDVRLADDITEDARERIVNLHRKEALSGWLQANVASYVESDLRNNPDSEWSTTVFSYLTGNQIAKACDLAIDTGNVRLATLISQCPGDADFKEDLRAQLTLWREQRVDAHVSDDVRKIYALLAGVVDILEGSNGAGPERCPNLPIAKGLDWKRAFGVQLWFGQSMDASISDVFAAYHESIGTNASSPIPWYKETSTSQDQDTPMWKTPEGADPPDILYSLIRLFAEPNLSLSDVLIPFSYGAAPLDYRLSWHLYIILSRNVDPDDHVEGHSPSADLLANSYAMQLERLGLIQEAAFVLLHIEGSAGRKSAIKELLCRSAPTLDAYMLKGLCGSLRIPDSWVHEAKAVHALSRSDVYGAYEYYLQAGMYNAAHDIAVMQLAPDVVIRKDMALLQELFQRFSGQPVRDWNVRGKVFLDYAHAMIRLPELREFYRTDAIPDASHTAEVEDFARSIPKLLAILPDVLPDRKDIRHKVAVSEMLTGLTLRLDQFRPLSVRLPCTRYTGEIS